MISPAFLAKLHWEERWLDLVTEGPVELPGYPGSTIRGALGAVMRPELCERRAGGGGCGPRENCGDPERCRFYSLFEQSRAAGGQGSNVPKPLILESPAGEPLRALAMGAPVEEPFTFASASSSGGGLLPVIENRWRLRPAPGTQQQPVLRVGLRGLGVAGAALDGVVEGVRRRGLDVQGGRLRLAGVTGGRCTFLPDGEEPPSSSPSPLRPAAPVRLALITPAIIRDSETGETCEDPARLGRAVLDQAVVRAVRVYNAFFTGGGVEPLPYVEPVWPGVAMTAHRLFRYRLPRHSYRQGRWMNFDGVVGWIEWEGPGVGALLPWLRAAEALHIGQKPTFGLGRVELVARR